MELSNINYPGSLHNHTDFSNFRLRDSINQVETLIDRAIELGHDIIGITDHETIASWVRVEKYYKKIKEAHPDFKVLRGNEIYLVRNGLNSDNFVPEWDKFYHFVLLAKDRIGAKQIMELSTRAWLRSYTYKRLVRVPTYYQDLIEVIGANPGHVIGSTACIGGALGTQLLRYKENNDYSFLQKIKGWCLQLKQIFGQDNFYLEMQPSYNNDQLYVNEQIVALSNELNIPYIITNDSHYPSADKLKIEKIFLNAQGGDREVESFYATTYLMGTEEIYRFMQKYLGDSVLQNAFANIKHIKDSCEDFFITKPLKIPNLMWRPLQSYKEEYNDWFEKIPFLKTFYESDRASDKYMVDAVIEGINKHSDLQNQEAYNEINLCLSDTWVSSQVNNADWSAYFLNLQNIIDECWNAGTIVGPGRGSGVGFLLLYVLDIIQINPLREKTKTFRFRFLNPDRVSVLDIDSDISGKKRAQVLSHLRDVYGQDRVANVLTLGTEKSKSAIQSAARGLGIDNDIASYLSSMIESDRGQLRTLAQTYYGDDENGFAANTQFRKEMDENYPELWEVAQAIEGLIVRAGIHAGGIIFVDEPFVESTALMRAPSGEIITQFDLHACEDVSLIKYDMLSVECIDRIQTCIDLACDYGYVERKPTLRETYESIIGIYKLERNATDMWELLQQHKVQSLFQMEGQTGIQGINLLQPSSVDDLAVLNSTLRLMAQEKGGEMPTEKLSRFKKDSSLWDEEIAAHNLDVEQTKALIEPILATSYGLCIAQEQFMQLVQLPQLGGMSLTDADKLRKSIAKKNPAAYEEWMSNYRKVCSEKGIDNKLVEYVIELIGMSKGYGFNQSHTLAYSLVALQEMNLAYKYPIILWNCACLITDAGGASQNSEENVVENINEEEIEYTSTIEEFISEEEDDDDEDDEDEEEESAEDVKQKKKKKKTSSVDYGKIAAAIGKMISAGITIAPPNINSSSFTFTPNIEKNEIRYGLSGITRVGTDLVKTIIENRPYSSVNDFLKKVKVNVLQMTALIKCGAFDDFGDRAAVLKDYIYSISDTKKRITLQNLKMLIDMGLIPDEFDLQRRVFYFNKHLKKSKEDGWYGLDNLSFAFYEQHFDIDDLVPANTESGFMISQSVWEKKYQHHMDILRPYVQAHNKELLDLVNENLVHDKWVKYCLGTPAKWEMESVSCYFHEHELENIDLTRHDIDNFEELPEEPEVDRYCRIKGKMVPLFRIRRIAGTVLQKDKNKKTVTLLTTSGVVTVKVFGNSFANYDRQISEKGEDGHKHVIESSWFKRGNKLIITGIRRGDTFIAKKYTATPYHLVELVTDIDADGYVKTVTCRADEVVE